METDPLSFYIQIVFALMSSSFSISVFPGRCVFPGGGNSKAPLLPAKAMKLYSEAQTHRAEVFIAQCLRQVAVLGLPLLGSRCAGDGVCTSHTLLCNWDRARVWLLELGSVPGSCI